MFESYKTKPSYFFVSPYLLSRKSELQKRKQYKEWYGYSAPRSLSLHDQANILIPLLANHGSFALSTNLMPEYCFMASAGFSLAIPKDIATPDINYILALLNSKLLFWLLEKKSNKFRAGWITCTKQYFGDLPIKIINYADSNEKAMHDQMVTLVNRMLDLNKKLPEATVPQVKTTIQRQIDSTDRQIDQLVYKLYDLTVKEIAIVEGK